jgi:Carboxypeptidase regulatory-like domain
MRNWGALSRALGVLAVLGLTAAAFAGDTTKLNITVKTQSGRPIDRASVIVRFVEGHSIVKLGKEIRTTYELRTNQEGEAKIPSIPQGKIRIQVIAKGYQTFGQIFDVTEDEKDIPIALNPPQQQYSSHQ